MSPDKLYEHLKEIAEKLGVSVVEQSFKQVGLPVKSGYCRVKGEDKFIMDKSLSAVKKNQTLARFLSTQPHENIYMPPVVRELLHKQK